jgi:hypothetical protein
VKQNQIGPYVRLAAFLLASLLPAPIFAQSPQLDERAEPERPSTQHSDEAASLVLPEGLALLPDAPSFATDQVPAAANQTPSQQPPAPVAQAPTPPPCPAKPAGDAAAPDPPAQAKPDCTPAAPLSAADQLKIEEKQRLLGVMPQFQVVMNGQAVVPLTAGQKWQLAAKSAIDPFYIGYAFVLSGGYGEIVDSHPGFGWGPEGYFKRVGAGYLDIVNGALIGNALLPSVLHQDPRYFRLGKGTIWHRFLYAAGSTVICKGDNGKWQPNVSNVLGNFVSGAISNAYYPAEERGVALTLENGLEVTAFGAVGGQILEFGPDLQRLLLRHKKKKTTVVIKP